MGLEEMRAAVAVAAAEAAEQAIVFVVVLLFSWSQRTGKNKVWLSVAQNHQSREEVKEIENGR